MKYKNEDGIFGNITRLFRELTTTNDNVVVNKNIAKSDHNDLEDALCESDSIDKIADIEEALIELESMIGEN